MNELRDRLRLLDKLSFPLEWDAVRNRQQTRGILPAHGSRATTRTVALAFFACGLILAWVALRPDGVPRTSGNGEDVPRPNTGFSVSVPMADGEHVGIPTVAETGLWLAVNSDAVAQTRIVLVERATGSVVDGPTVDGDVAELAGEGDVLWARGSNIHGRAVVWRIDTTTMLVTASLDLPDSATGPIVAAGGSLWVPSLAIPPNGRFEDAVRSVMRINESGQEITAEIQADVCTYTDEDCTPASVARGTNLVWFESVLPRQTISVDVGTNEARSIESGATCGLAANDTRAWVGVSAPVGVSNTAEQLQAIDAATGSIDAAPIPIGAGDGDSVSAGCPAAVFEGAVWVTGRTAVTEVPVAAELDSTNGQALRVLLVSEDETWPDIVFDLANATLWMKDGYDAVTVTAIDLAA